MHGGKTAETGRPCRYAHSGTGVQKSQQIGGRQTGFGSNFGFPDAAVFRKQSAPRSERSRQHVDAPGKAGSWIRDTSSRGTRE
jgi:hypothetical protein